MELVEVGKIVNTHGVRGEVKITPYTNTPEFFLRFKTLYLREKPYRVLLSRAHSGNVIVSLDGVDAPETAHTLRNIAVFAEKSEAALDEGEHFIADLIGLRAVDDETGEAFGEIADFLALPSNGVYVVKGEREILIPAVPEFVRKIDVAGGEIRFKRIEGM